jgi:hypothetical protein
MYQKTITPNANAPVTPSELATFGKFELPQQYVSGSSPQTTTDQWNELVENIAAATEQVEIIAQTAVQQEQILYALDFFPNTDDWRQWEQNQLAYSYIVGPFWWFGFPTHDSIELVRRSVQVPTLTESFNITSVVFANNEVTIGSNSVLPDWVVAGAVIEPNGTAEGDVNQPSSQPTGVPFLNGVPLTVSSVNGNSFTAPFPNFYTTDSDGVVVPQTYTNDSDSGTASLVTNPLILTYNDPNGVNQIWSTIYYDVYANKITLTVGNVWPCTDHRQDCIQITYWAGNATSPAANGLPANSINPKLKKAVKYLALHMWENPSYVAVETTSEVYGTLCMMLESFKTFRIPR